ncbi:hypothetical protein ATZ36_13065 [Candidatus Endomicrobiellum trichonymphae]|uniref:Uncharacterized protein n=1 Tax=Endomicrobium trichonymphae TaxID=1408204 RepID=A0A1E5IML5_ENDTX|nr:hypothetical protein ATZ36_13065 [Candidatus Endomicrobium trichonymphae]
MPNFFVIIYNVLFVLFLPLIAVVVLFSNKYRKEFFYRLSERFAVYKPLNKKSKTTLWIHTALRLEKYEL